MQRSAVLLPLLIGSLAGCAGANPLRGAWVVDVARTQAALADVALTESQRAVMARPDFYGDMSYVFDDDHVLVVIHGVCTGPLPYRIAKRTGSVVELVFADAEGEEEEIALDLRDRELRAELGGGLAGTGAIQIFAATPYAALAARYRCVSAAGLLP